MKKLSNEVKTLVLNTLQPNQTLTKLEIKERTKLDGRTIRQAISELVIEGNCIVAVSNKKGYTRLDQSNEHFKQIVEHQIAELQSRVNVLNDRITSLSKYL